jgi:uncharacterized protein YkwD
LKNLKISMKSSKKVILVLLVGSLGCTISSCGDPNGGTPNPNGGSSASLLDAPSAVNVEFTSNEDATITFDKSSTSQTTFNVRFTDQYDVVTEYEGEGNSPIMISGIPKGEIYAVEMAGGTTSGVGEYGDKIENQLASGKADVNLDRIKMYTLINEARAEARTCGTENMPAVEPMVWDDKLEEAAEIHTVDMEKNNFFAHTSKSDGSDPGQRITRVGYSWSTYGENIASGYATEEAAMAGWLSSPGHCSNIMKGSFKEMGVYREGNKWTQVFGRSN